MNPPFTALYDGSARVVSHHTLVLSLCPTEVDPNFSAIAQMEAEQQDDRAQESLEHEHEVGDHDLYLLLAFLLVCLHGLVILSTVYILIDYYE